MALGATVKIKPPKALGKLRYVQQPDFAEIWKLQRRDVFNHLPLLAFATLMTVGMVYYCLTDGGTWGNWAITAFLIIGTAAALYDYVGRLFRVVIGLVCDRGVGYGWFRRDGTLARQKWYVFKPDTTMDTWKTRGGRMIPGGLQREYCLAFCDGGKRRFVLSYLAGTHVSGWEFMQQAHVALLRWQFKHRATRRIDPS